MPPPALMSTGRCSQHGWPQRVRCGPAAVPQPRLPSHGLQCPLSSICVRPAIECPVGPLRCSLSSGVEARVLGVWVLGSSLGHSALRTGFGSWRAWRVPCWVILHLGRVCCCRPCSATHLPLGGGGRGWHKGEVNGPPGTSGCAHCFALFETKGTHCLFQPTEGQYFGYARVGQLSPRQRRRGVGGWHKALVVGSVSLWRRLLASRP